MGKPLTVDMEVTEKDSLLGDPALDRSGNRTFLVGRMLTEVSQRLR
jgi:hypothetical protein